MGKPRPQPTEAPCVEWVPTTYGTALMLLVGGIFMGSVTLPCEPQNCYGWQLGWGLWYIRAESFEEAKFALLAAAKEKPNG